MLHFFISFHLFFLFLFHLSDIKIKIKWKNTLLLIYINFKIRRRRTSVDEAFIKMLHSPTVSEEMLQASHTLVQQHESDLPQKGITINIKK